MLARARLDQQAVWKSHGASLTMWLRRLNGARSTTGCSGAQPFGTQCIDAADLYAAVSQPSHASGGIAL
jgi:hypothetical protein